MSILKAAGLIAILSLISKFVGLFREQVILFVYGTNYIRDAYGIASLWPSSFALVMLAGLNGPFHSSVVSVITKYKSQGETKNIKTVLFTLTILSCLFMGLITLLCSKFAPELINFIASKHAPAQTKSLAVLQFRIMCPMFLFSALIGISYGILNVEKIYITPSLSPVMASIAVIVAMFVSPVESLPVALAWGTMIGAVLQLLLQLIPLFNKFKDYLGFSFQPRHPGILLIISILLPASLSSIVGQVNLLIMTYFGSALPEGSISAMTSANYIFQLPLGIMLTALLVPMLPILNESVILEDNNLTFKKNINKSMRSLIFLSVPATAILLCSGKELIQVLFERGAFNQHSTMITYQSLASLSISVVFYAIRDLLVRVFYALDNARVPFYTSFFSISLMAFFCWVLTRYFGFKVAGISLAISFVTIFNMFVLSLILKKKIGSWLEKETLAHLLKVILATFPVIIFCLEFNTLVGYRFTIPVFIIYLTALGMVGTISIGVLRVLKDAETIEITDKILARLKR